MAAKGVGTATILQGDWMMDTFVTLGDSDGSRMYRQSKPRQTEAI